jgi:hypothetical protein
VPAAVIKGHQKRILLRGSAATAGRRRKLRSR